ncbi:MAG: RimK family alpha-L-glutamate ligase [Bdellovibrio sp.]
MKLKILASTALADSTRLIQKAAQSLGIAFEVLLLDQIQMSPAGILHQNVQVLADAKTLIWPRLGTLSRERGLEVCRQFEAQSFRLLNSSQAMELSSDKIMSLKALGAAGVPVPKTWFFSPEDRLKLADLDTSSETEKIKFWIKTQIGSQGIGVSWAYDAIQALAQMDLVRVSHGAGLIQAHVQGEDLRVLVDSGRVLGAMRRQATGADPRANLHQGAVAVRTNLTLQETQISLKSVEILGLTNAGVDLIRSSSGTVVIEVNPSPGLVGLSKCMSVNLSLDVLSWHLAHSKKAVTTRTSLAKDPARKSPGNT